MDIKNICHPNFNIKTYSIGFKNKSVTSSISNANNFDLYDRALSNYNQINFMGRVSISKEELQDYILEHPNENQREIAGHFKVSTTFISKLIKKYDIEYKKQYRGCITPEELQNYIDKHPEENQEKLAKHFGVSTSKICYLITKHEIKYKKPAKHCDSIISEKKLSEYLEQYCPTYLREIAEHFHISISTSQKLLKKYGLEYNRIENKSSVSKEELRDYIKQYPNENQREIGKHFGVSATTINNLIKKYGLEYETYYKTRVSPKELQSYIDKHPDYNLKQIAQHFQIKSSRIGSIIAKNNLRYEKKYSTAVCNDNEIQKCINEHPDYTQQEIADALGVSMITIVRHIQNGNIVYTNKQGRKHCVCK